MKKAISLLREQGAVARTPAGDTDLMVEKNPEIYFSLIQDICGDNIEHLKRLQKSLPIAFQRRPYVHF